MLRPPPLLPRLLYLVSTDIRVFAEAYSSACKRAWCTSGSTEIPDCGVLAEVGASRGGDLAWIASLERVECWDKIVVGVCAREAMGKEEWLVVVDVAAVVVCADVGGDGLGGCRRTISG